MVVVPSWKYDFQLLSSDLFVDGPVEVNFFEEKTQVEEVKPDDPVWYREPKEALVANQSFDVRALRQGVEKVLKQLDEELYEVMLTGTIHQDLPHEEVKLWRDTFPHLRVVGNQCTLHRRPLDYVEARGQTEAPFDESYHIHTETDDEKEEATGHLTIEGNRVKIVPCAQEEILLLHGCYEETLLIHVSDSTDNDLNSSQKSRSNRKDFFDWMDRGKFGFDQECRSHKALDESESFLPSPRSSVKQQAVDQMFDQVWKTLVPSMAIWLYPLVRREYDRKKMTSPRKLHPITASVSMEDITQAAHKPMKSKRQTRPVSEYVRPSTSRLPRPQSSTPKIDMITHPKEQMHPPWARTPRDHGTQRNPSTTTNVRPKSQKVQPTMAVKPLRTGQKNVREKSPVPHLPPISSRPDEEPSNDLRHDVTRVIDVKMNNFSVGTTVPQERPSHLDVEWAQAVTEPRARMNRPKTSIPRKMNEREGRKHETTSRVQLKPIK
ncbi:hypothetical protein PROFUN_07072 [Planoprotostelium fungivorum]|uniref:Uncharacterized protein n=1 Tax=Planoprotostelium fungivorum TaxID=1890364 RepID=A0A2P6NN13_9EUKA|nr:hypothetical protein PROFUN_07072 [Planoprotostelium fungivorum]